MSRPETDTYFLAMALLVASRGTCLRRRVGCVLVSRDRHVLATGYNGSPSGHAHCLDAPCAGAGAASGTALDLCEAVHAEQNALLQCRQPERIHTVYVTTTPCMACTKMLLNTPAVRIVAAEAYAAAHLQEVKRLWWPRHLTIASAETRRDIALLLKGLSCSS